MIKDYAVNKPFRYKKFIINLALLPMLVLPVANTAEASQHQTVTKQYYVQVATFKTRHLAENTLLKLQKKHHANATIVTTQAKGHSLYEVQMGPFNTVQEAQASKKQIAALAPSAYVRSHAASVINHPVHAERATFSAPSSTSVKPFRFGNVPYAARAYVDGTLADRTNFADADLMLPVIGNNDWIGYLDGAGKYGDDHAWYGSVGTGIRAVKHNALFGAYVFVDSNTSTNNNDFWIINPGIEFMTTTIDAHVNAYAPISSRSKSMGIVQGARLGINKATIQNRTLFDNLYNVMEVVGPGVDGELGYTFKQLYNIRPFIGGYHFNAQQHTRINGIEGGIEMPVNSNVTFLVHAAHDSVQNSTVMGTLRLTMGGIPKTPAGYATVNDRMLDPLQRHLGAYQTGAGIPITKINKPIGRTPIIENIWFFNTGGADFILANGLANCTIENPCGTLSQATIDDINTLAPNANFFFNTGTYNNPAVGNAFALNNGQNFYGRTNYFLRAADGANRPLINDTLLLNGNNIIKNLQINGNSVVSTYKTGIQITPAAVGSVNISNSLVTTTVDGQVNLSAIGIYNFSPQVTANIDQTHIIMNASNGTGTYLIGLDNSGAGINLSNSTIQVNANNYQASAEMSPMAIFSGIVNVSNTTFNLNAINTGTAIGVFNNNGLLNINNSSINVIADLSQLTTAAYGIEGKNNTVTNLNGVKMNVVAVNSPPGVSVGLFGPTGSSPVFNYQNSSIRVSANSPGNAEAIGTNSTATYNNQGNVICTIVQNGVVSSVACP